MRSVLLSSAMLAALSAAALTPRPAAAQAPQGQATVYVYPPYYNQGYSYSTPYYTRSYSTTTNYYAPTVSPAYAAPAYPYAVNVIGPAPIYSGPQYFHGYSPSRYWIYP